MWPFPGSPFGESSALVKVVTWHQTDTKPIPKPMLTWHHLREDVRGLSIVSKNIFSETNYIDTFTYIYRRISCPERPHTSNINLWINNAHVFNASSVNPGARTGPQLDILCPPAHGTLENRNGSCRTELLREGFWGRGTVPGCGVTVSLMLCVSAYTYI